MRSFFTCETLLIYRVAWGVPVSVLAKVSGRGQKASPLVRPGSPEHCLISELIFLLCYRCVSVFKGKNIFLSHALIEPLNSRLGEFCHNGRKPGEPGAQREQSVGKEMQKQMWGTISNCIFSETVSVTFWIFLVTLALAGRTASLVWVNNNRFYCWELVQLQSVILLLLCAGTTCCLTHHSASSACLASGAPNVRKRECFLLTWYPDSVQQHVRQVLAELRRNGRIVWKRDMDVTGLLIQIGLCWAEPLACVEMGPNLCWGGKLCSWIRGLWIVTI